MYHEAKEGVKRGRLSEMIPSVGTSVSYRRSRLEEFRFTSQEMIVFADLLLHAVNAKKDLEVRLGDRLVHFTYGLEIGRAEITADETLVITSNRYDLAGLAGDLRELANLPEEEHYQHIHLEEEHYQHIHLGQPEGVFMNTSETVHDIVFEFRDITQLS